MTATVNVLNEKEMVLKPWQTLSSRLCWPGFRIENYCFPAMHLPPFLAKGHIAVFNTGSPVFFSAKSSSRWQKYHCVNGSIVQLISPGELSETQWDNQFDALHLSVDSTFMDHLTETENFSFTTQINVNDAWVADELFKLIKEINANNFEEKIYTESLVLSCIVHLACTYPNHGKKMFAPKGKLSAGQLKHVIDYARTYIQTNISLTQLATCANLSAFHFARLFRQTVGISPYQFVLQMKIEYAKKLIRQHSRSISDVAYILNFTDQAHFSNAFKKITGICPRQFLQTTVVH